jgi:HK97 family phage major capsid protein
MVDEIKTQMNALAEEFKSLKAEGKFEESNAKFEEFKALENELEAAKLAQANEAALENKTNVLNIENQSIENIGGVKKMDVFNVNEIEKEDLIATAEYKNAFLKKLQGKELTQFENAAVSAASVIPTETMNKIIEKMEYIAPILAKVSVSYIASNLTIPAENVTNDASWVAMGTASTDSADSTTSISLAAYKLIKTIEIGADTSVMAINAFETYLVDKLSKKMAKALENAIINGTGSAQPTGLLASGIITNTGTYTMAGMTYTDLLAIIADLPDNDYRAGATFVMPSALFYSDVLPALTDKGSGLDVQAVEKQKVLGYDVILCDRLAAGTVIFGNLENYAMNFAQGVEIKSDASVGFRTGSTVYRAMALVDGKPLNVAAFNKYTRALS